MFSIINTVLTCILMITPERTTWSFVLVLGANIQSTEAKNYR